MTDLTRPETILKIITVADCEEGGGGRIEDEKEVDEETDGEDAEQVGGDEDDDCEDGV